MPSMARKRKLERTEPEVGRCPHGKPYTYQWVWDSAAGETEEDSEPVYLKGPDCERCYPEDDPDE